MKDAWREQKPVTAKIADLVKQKMDERGLKPTPFSTAVSGHIKTIPNLMQGRSPSPDLLAKICEELDLEFYIGARRSNATVNLDASGSKNLEDTLAEVRAFQTEIGLDGYLAILLETSKGTLRLVAPPDLSKALADQVTYHVIGHQNRLKDR